MKKLLAVLLVFVLLLGGGASYILIDGHYFVKSGDVQKSNTDWMSLIKDETLLTDIVMPGSHDAGTFNMSYLGRTQGYSVASQLDMGARYFDLRVNKTEDGLYMYHSILNGETFDDVLSAIVSFIEENKSEVLILDFQHFKGGSEGDVLSIVTSALVDKGLAVKNQSGKSDLEFISELTLGGVRGKCVILFGGNEELVSQHDFLFGRNNDECTKGNKVLNSCYISEYNKMNSEAFIDTALPYYYENIKDKIDAEGYKGLFVLQGQLTDGYLIFGPYSKEKRHDENMTDYIKGIKEDAERLALTNIIMRDFLTSEKCNDIIALNYFKGNVKEEHTGDFESLL